MQGLFNGIKEKISNVVELFKSIFKKFIDFVKGSFSKGWKSAWDGIANVFKNIWSGIANFFENALNKVIDGANWLITQANKLSFTAPDWVPEWLGGGKTIGINIPKISRVSIPHLRQCGRTSNREFMAVLGDQHHGNNLEAPEDLIRQIVREEAGSLNTDLLQAILEAIRAGHIIKVNEDVLGRTTVKTINNFTRQSGKPVLLL